MKVEIKQNHKFEFYWTVLVNGESIYSSEEFNDKNDCIANMKTFITAIEKCLDNSK